MAVIANLMGSSVDFIACDMPEANRLTLHILAAVAEHECEMIFKRTYEALAAKAHGHDLAPATVQAHVVAEEMLASYRASVGPMIRYLHRQGFNVSAIVREMNRWDITTMHGRLCHPATVKLYL